MVNFLDRLIIHYSRRHYKTFVRAAWEDVMGHNSTVHAGEALEAIIFLTKLTEGDLERVATALVDTLPPGHPLVPAFINHLIFYIALPPRAMTARVASVLADTLLPSPSPSTLPFSLLGHSTKEPTYAQRMNIPLVLEALASRLAGPPADAMGQPHVLTSLASQFARAPTPDVRLAALLALEAFARTGVVKKRIRSGTDVVETCARTLEDRDRWVEEWAEAASPLLLGAEWAMSHTWSRSPNLDPAQYYGDARIVLDPSRASGRGAKYSKDGLSVRNDQSHFVTIPASSPVRRRGRWFYEVTLDTAGIMQIGWVLPHALEEMNAEVGIGIGDVGCSVGLDIHRGTVWYHSERIRYFPRRMAKGQAGDVVGVLLDLEASPPECRFYLNGHTLDGFGTIYPKHTEDLQRMWESIIQPPKEPVEGEDPRECVAYPAISLSIGQQVTFNFGTSPFRYIPEGRIRTLQETSHLPLHLSCPTIDMVDEEEAGPGEGPACGVCCRVTKEGLVELRPCGHKDMCRGCAEQCEGRCPWCRCEFVLA